MDGWDGGPFFSLVKKSPCNRFGGQKMGGKGRKMKKRRSKRVEVKSSPCKKLVLKLNAIHTGTYCTTTSTFAVAGATQYFVL